MDAIQQLQHDAMDSGVPTSDLLRKALVVARKLNVPSFEDWITKELHGYAEGDPLPAYRKFVGQVMAKHPIYGWRLIHFEDPSLAKAASDVYTLQSAGELEHLLKDGHARFGLPFSHENVLAIMEALGPYATQPTTQVPAAPARECPRDGPQPSAAMGAQSGTGRRAW